MTLNQNCPHHSLHPRKRKILFVVLLLGIGNIIYQAPRSYALTVAKSKVVDYTKNIHIRHGDFIFQHLPGPLTEMVAAVTQSPYSHCGIIVKRGEQWFVLEAIGPVKFTPIDEWISRGVNDKFTIVRLKEAYQPRIPRIVRQAERYLNRPYDIQYEWDDRKIYCSELIYKAAWEGAGIPLARFVKLGDLSWRPYEEDIRDIAGGYVPLDREMITPEDLALSDKVQTVYSSFPARDRKEGKYDRGAFQGAWRGTYMLLGIPLNVLLNVDKTGRIIEGTLGSGLVFEPKKMDTFQASTGEFAYGFISENDVRIDIEGRMDKSQTFIFGKWKDSVGFSGTFSMSKKE